MSDYKFYLLTTFPLGGVDGAIGNIEGRYGKREEVLVIIVYKYAKWSFSVWFIPLSVIELLAL